MSMIMFPIGSSTSMPMPIAAAMGSWIRYTSLALACSALSRTARFSTSVMPLGMQITMRRLGVKSWRPGLIIRIMPLIMSSAALKSAITPSFSGRMVLMFSCVFPCICCAARPMAITLPVLRSTATMLGSSTTTLSLKMMRVLAVPRSIAISWVRKLNRPIRCAQCLKWRLPVMHMAMPCASQ